MPSRRRKGHRTHRKKEPPRLTTDLRDLRGWLVKNSGRSAVWVVWNQLNEILKPDTLEMHPVGVERLEVLPLSSKTLIYVYSAVMSNNNLFCILQDQSFYYLIKTQQRVHVVDQKQMDIDLEEEDLDLPEDLPEVLPGDGDGDGSASGGGGEGEVEDEPDERNFRIDLQVWYSNTLHEIVRVAQSQKDTRMHLKLKTIEISSPYAGILPTDLIGKLPGDQRRLWNQFVAPSEQRALDFTGFTTVHEDILEDTEENPNITEIVFSQNLFPGFEWLRAFPNVQRIAVWSMPGLTNEQVKQMVEYCPKLKCLQLNQNPQLDVRVLLAIKDAPHLRELVIAQPALPFKKDHFNELISEEEWDFENHTLEILMLNSEIVSVLGLAGICRCFRQLKNFIMCQRILLRTNEWSRDGDNPDRKIHFRWEKKPNETGFTRAREVHFMDLNLQKGEIDYSDTMLRKIREKHPDMADEWREAPDPNAGKPKTMIEMEERIKRELEAEAAAAAAAEETAEASVEEEAEAYDRADPEVEV